MKLAIVKTPSKDPTLHVRSNLLREHVQLSFWHAPSLKPARCTLAAKRQIPPFPGAVDEDHGIAGLTTLETFLSSCHTRSGLLLDFLE